VKGTERRGRNGNGSRGEVHERDLQNDDERDLQNDDERDLQNDDERDLQNDDAGGKGRYIWNHMTNMPVALL
jgi:hypothetical protein